MMYVLEYLIYHLRPYGISSYVRPKDRKLIEHHNEESQTKIIPTEEIVKSKRNESQKLS